MRGKGGDQPIQAISTRRQAVSPGLDCTSQGHRLWGGPQLKMKRGQVFKNTISMTLPYASAIPCYL